MVRNVVKICPELKFETFVDRGHFHDCEVQVSIVWSQQRVAAFAAEMTSSRYAIRSIRTSDERAWHRERRQIQKLGRIAVIVLDRRHYIRPSESFAASVVVAFIVVVQAEGMAAHQGQNAAKRPAFPKFL